MSPKPANLVQHAVQKIVVRLKVGDDRMSGTDDPVFLRIMGPAGREFRLVLAHGRSLRRGAEDVFVLGPPDDPETNVAHPELNDPTRPPLALDGMESVAIWKGMEPLPNVRGLGEMDDRLEVDEVEVLVYAPDRAKPARFYRRGPLWLGLICGQSFELPPDEPK
ncbi:MAG: hypothetical protein O7A09_04045 [Proteobacteria bacterium]|nr:hypothetical protein [Pseudomonadota bacterium]